MERRAQSLIWDHIEPLKVYQSIKKPVGSQVDKPKHSKAYKTRFVGFFVFKAHQKSHIF